MPGKKGGGPPSPGGEGWQDSPPIPTPTPTPTPDDPGESLGPPDASTDALESTAEEEQGYTEETQTAANDLLSTARYNGLSDPYAPSQDGWSSSLGEVNPYTNVATGPGALDAFAGEFVDPYTGVIPADANHNAFTGSNNVDPFGGLDQFRGDPGHVDTSHWLASNEPMSTEDTSQQPTSGGPAPPGTPPPPATPVENRSGKQYTDATNLTNATPFPDKVPINGTDYSHGQVTLNGVTYEYYFSDKATPPGAPDLKGYALLTPVSQQAATGGAAQPGSASPAAGAPSVPPTSPATPPASTPASPPGAPPAPAGRTAVQVSQAGSTIDQAVRRAFQPTDALVNPLRGPLNLYSEGAARARASAAPGYLISQTKYYGPADAAEAALRARLGIPTARLPTGPYNDIWGKASVQAVRDAALSGSVTSHNDLATLSKSSIQSIYELKALKLYGGGAGALGIVTGAALIYGGTQQRNPTLAGAGIVGGSLELAGGGALLAGALRTSAPLQQVGRGLGTAGSIALAPLTAYAFQDDLSRGQWFDSVVDATSFASAALTVGGTLAGSAALAEAGLVLGAFGIGVLIGTGIDKGLEAASKGLLGIDLSSSAIIAAELTAVDTELTSLWADPSKPAYTQTIGWKLAEWLE